MNQASLFEPAQELVDLAPPAAHHPVDAMSDSAVLEALIDAPGAAPVAQLLLRRFGSLGGVLGASFYSLQRAPGVSPAIAQRLQLVQAVSVRIAREEAYKRPVLASWGAVTVYLKAAMAHEGREQFRVIFLDKKNAIIADEIMGRGTVDHAPVYPREVMRQALELDASAIILVHNHPSGDPSPSAADIDMTRQVVQAGRALRISVHDHIVVGRDGLASFKALGLM